MKIEMAAMGTRRVRLTNIPPEPPDEAVGLCFSHYGELKEMQREIWSKAFPYKAFRRQDRSDYLSESHSVQFNDSGI